MPKEPLISVVIYIKKSPEGLKKCLETLKLQMYKDIEIICANSEESEEISALLATYEEYFDRFKVVNCIGSDSAQAWNNGLKTAQGKYIQFINSDCWFLLDMYKVFADTSADIGPDISILNSALYREDIIDIPFYELFDSEDLTENSDSMIYSLKNIHNIMTKNLRVLNKIYKKEFLDKNSLSFLENNIYCEYLFNLQSLLKSSSVYINPEVYMRHTEQIITDGAHTEKVFDIFDIITRMQEYLISENILGKFVFEFFNYICNSLDKYYQYCPDDLKQEYFEKLKLFIMSRFNSMPPDIQNNYKKIDEVNFLITSDFEEYDKKQLKNQ